MNPVDDAVAFLDSFVESKGVDYAEWARQAVRHGFADVAYLNARWAAHDAFDADPSLRGEK